MQEPRGRHKRKGLAFIIVLAFILLLAVAGASVIFLSSTEIKMVGLQRDSTKAFYISEGGADYAIAWLTCQPVPPPQTGVLDIGISGPQSLGEGAFTVTITADANNPTRTLKRYVIRSIGVVRESQREIVVEVEVKSFAQYSYFTNKESMLWGGQEVAVWFITGDRLEGPVHTNTHFNISGNPVFTGVVSSYDDFISYMHGGPPLDNPDFQQGIQLGVDSIDMPGEESREELRQTAESGGLVLTGNTTVALLGNGTMNVTNQGRGWVGQNMPLPGNGVLYVNNGDLYMSGTLNGELTAASSEDIIVTDNIRYNQDPRVDPDSTDVLGLVAKDSVIISWSAPYDVEIDASIMAMEGSLTVEQWWQGPPKGLLTVYGGIIQYARGPVGTFSSWSGGKQSGYSKDYQYDPRLNSSFLPCYPVTGDYIVLTWKEE